VQIDPVGVIWGLVAATGLATYFIVAADDSHGIPPLFVAAGGLAIGAAALFLAGLTGVVTLSWATADVVLAGFSVPWWLDVVILGVVAAAFAYLSGIGGSRRLGSKLASFVGLSEVLFAVLWAWLLLQEMPVTIQLIGGGLILAGVAVVRLDEAPQPQGEPAAAGTRAAAGE
jgi:drug/metabolite transporter (DMT)-like permease